MSKTIFGQVETADGSAVSNGQIIFNLKGSVSQPGIGVLAPKTIACALPSNGVFSQPLIANDELSPGGSSYAVTVLDAAGHQILSKVSVFAGVSPIPVVVFQDNNPANSSTGWYANTPVTNDAINLPPSLYAGGPPLKQVTGGPFLYSDGSTPVSGGSVTFTLSQDAIVAGFAAYGFEVDPLNNVTFYSLVGVDLPAGTVLQMIQFNHSYLNTTCTVISTSGNKIYCSAVGVSTGVVAFTADTGQSSPYNVLVCAGKPITATLDVNGNIEQPFELYGNDFLSTQDGINTTVYNMVVEDSTGAEVYKNNVALSGSSPISLGQLVSAPGFARSATPPLSVKVPKTSGPTSFVMVGTPSPSSAVVFNSGVLSGAFTFSASLEALGGNGTTPSVTVHWTDPTLGAQSAVVIATKAVSASITAWLMLGQDKVTPAAPGSFAFAVQFTASNSFIAGQGVEVSGLAAGASLNTNFFVSSANSSSFTALVPYGKYAAGAATENGLAELLPWTFNGTQAMTVAAGTDVTISLTGQSGADVRYGINVGLVYAGN